MSYTVKPNTSFEALSDYGVNAAAALNARSQTRPLAARWRERVKAVRAARAAREEARDVWLEALATYQVSHTDWYEALVALSGLIYLASGKKSTNEPYQSILGTITAARARSFGATRALEFSSLALARLGVLGRADFAGATATLQAAHDALVPAAAARRAAYEALRLHNLHRVRLIEETQTAVNETEIEILKAFPGKTARVRDVLAPPRADEKKEEKEVSSTPT
jgi:hypothetical protein